MVNFVLIDGNIYVGFFTRMRKGVTFLLGLVGPICSPPVGGDVTLERLRS